MAGRKKRALLVAMPPIAELLPANVASATADGTGKGGGNRKRPAPSPTKGEESAAAENCGKVVSGKDAKVQKKDNAKKRIVLNTPPSRANVPVPEKCVICLSLRRCAHVKKHPCKGAPTQLCGPFAVCLGCTDQMMEKFHPGVRDGESGGHFVCPTCLAPLGGRARALVEGRQVLKWPAEPETPCERWHAPTEHPMQAAVRGRNVAECRRIHRELSDGGALSQDSHPCQSSLLGNAAGTAATIVELPKNVTSPAPKPKKGPTPSRRGKQKETKCVEKVSMPPPSKSLTREQTTSSQPPDLDAVNDAPLSENVGDVTFETEISQATQPDAGSPPKKKESRIDPASTSGAPAASTETPAGKFRESSLARRLRRKSIKRPRMSEDIPATSVDASQSLTQAVADMPKDGTDDQHPLQKFQDTSPGRGMHRQTADTTTDLVPLPVPQAQEQCDERPQETSSVAPPVDRLFSTQGNSPELEEATNMSPDSNLQKKSANENKCPPPDECKNMSPVSGVRRQKGASELNRDSLGIFSPGCVRDSLVALPPLERDLARLVDAFFAESVVPETNPRRSNADDGDADGNPDSDAATEADEDVELADVEARSSDASVSRSSPPRDRKAESMWNIMSAEANELQTEADMRKQTSALRSVLSFRKQDDSPPSSSSSDPNETRAIAAVPHSAFQKRPTQTFDLDISDVGLQEVQNQKAGLSVAPGDQLEHETSECERIRLENENRERELVENDQAEQKRAEFERAERQRAEQERADAERAERDRVELELAKVERERIERDERERAERERESQKRAEAERVRLERQLVEAEAERVRLERERESQKRAEGERIRLERQRVEAEVERVRLERERAEAERQRAEAERDERYRKERERVERERLERERAEAERAERERKDLAERNRLERERAEADRAEQERTERECAERARLERERIDSESVQRERTEAVERDKAAAERERADRERTKSEHENAERERALRGREKIDRENAERERLERKRKERERTSRAERGGDRNLSERDRADGDRANRERRAGDDRRREKHEKERHDKVHRGEKHISSRGRMEKPGAERRRPELERNKGSVDNGVDSQLGRSHKTSSESIALDQKPQSSKGPEGKKRFDQDPGKSRLERKCSDLELTENNAADRKRGNLDVERICTDRGHISRDRGKRKHVEHEPQQLSETGRGHGDRQGQKRIDATESGETFGNHESTDLQRVEREKFDQFSQQQVLTPKRGRLHMPITPGTAASPLAAARWQRRVAQADATNQDAGAQDAVTPKFAKLAVLTPGTAASPCAAARWRRKLAMEVMVDDTATDLRPISSVAMTMRDCAPNGLKSTESDCDIRPEVCNLFSKFLVQDVVGSREEDDQAFMKLKRECMVSKGETNQKLLRLGVTDPAKLVTGISASSTLPCEGKAVSSQAFEFLSPIPRPVELLTESPTVALGTTSGDGANKSDGTNDVTRHPLRLTKSPSSDGGLPRLKNGDAAAALEVASSPPPPPPKRRRVLPEPPCRTSVQSTGASDASAPSIAENWEDMEVLSGQRLAPPDRRPAMASIGLALSAFGLPPPTSPEVQARAAAAETAFPTSPAQDDVDLPPPAAFPAPVDLGTAWEKGPADDIPQIDLPGHCLPAASDLASVPKAPIQDETSINQSAAVSSQDVIPASRFSTTTTNKRVSDRHRRVQPPSVQPSAASSSVSRKTAMMLLKHVYAQRGPAG